MGNSAILHIPVLAEEVLINLRLKKGMTIADCTAGTGGHAAEILKRIGGSGYLIGIDRDKEALIEAKARLAGISDRFKF